VNIPVGPNSVTYTLMGAVHKFLMHTDFEVVAVITKSERKKRQEHILVEEDGPPEPMVPGFVVPGDQNSGSFPNRGERCPLSELRLAHLKTGEEMDSHRPGANEHWCVMNGIVDLEVDGQKLQLHAGDVALLRAGATRHLRAVTAARLVFLRE
jgi:mannose-6-phosphate isomerase-like protein (cupin superfamily)